VDFEIVVTRGLPSRTGLHRPKFILFETLCSRASENKKTFAAFIDIRKAFDTVWRKELWWKLWNIGFQGKFWSIERVLYESEN